MKRWMKWGLAALVVVLLAGGVLRALSARKAQQAQLATPKAESVVELAATDVLKAQERELAQGLPISGTLRAVNSAVVKARVAGELQGLTVREGDAVKAGQVIARVDATEYQSRVRQAQQQADSAKAQVDIAQKQFENNQALVDQGFISRTALDTSLSSLNAARATHNAALAAVDVARKSVDDTVLRAPISGLVSQRVAQPGERVGVDAKIVEIVDLSRLELEASLSPADSVDVRVGQSATLRIEGSAPGATSAAGSRTVAARVVRINPSAQAGSRNVLAYLGIDDPAGLRQGLFAQGTLGTASTRALAVPVSAVRTDRPTPYVQLIEGGRVVHRNVTLGARGTGAGNAASEAWVAVSGLADGATVVAGSVGALREGTAVRFTAQPPAGTTPANAGMAPASAGTPASAPAKSAP
jgi:RND family efflux transporter MFP subunit